MILRYRDIKIRKHPGRNRGRPGGTLEAPRWEQEHQEDTHEAPGGNQETPRRKSDFEAKVV